MSACSQSLGDRLQGAQARQFVGREAQLEIFRSALSADRPPFAVLHIQGPGGIGKTALLREFARLATNQGRTVCRVDARDIEISPPGFLRALRGALGREASGRFDVRAEWPARTVLLLDTFELASSLGGWLREIFLPKLPADGLTVIAGREPPAPEWRADPAWASITRFISLPTLAADEGRALLLSHGVPTALTPQVQSLAGGNPLALGMIADIARLGGFTESLALESRPEIVHALLDKLLDRVPSPEHRRALAAAAVARTTTEALLIDLLGDDAGPRCFAWLRARSFMEHGPHGIHPHDCVRELLDADWRWRNPEVLASLQERVLAHLRQRFAAATPVDRQRWRQENMFARRRDPGMAAYFAWDRLGQAYAEPATVDDHTQIIGLVARHRGEQSAQIVRYWLAREPDAFQVFRTMEGAACGFMCNLELRGFDEETLRVDPAIATARAYIAAQGQLHADDVVLYLRFWMDQDGQQRPSAAVNLTAAHSVTTWLTLPNLAWNFIAIVDPGFWAPHFTSIRIARCPQADFEIDGHRYGVFAHDWRAEPPADWDSRRGRAQTPPTSRAPGLSRQQFEAAVRAALKDYARPARLASNPLVETTPAELQARLREAVALLDGHPRDRKHYLAVWHTYFEPAPKQEAAAERLELPFSTYRYHLARGCERIAAALWAHYSRRSTLSES